MTKIRIELTGDKALDKAINKLTDKIARKVLKKAVRVGNTIERKAMKKAAPIGKSRPGFPGGDLKRSIKSKIKSYPSSNTVVGITGPDVKISNTQHFTEEGTDDREHKSGKSTGKVTATHWARNAHEAVKARSAKAVREKLAKEIEAEVKKLR